jgi:hypothetical protein
LHRIVFWSGQKGIIHGDCENEIGWRDKEKEMAMEDKWENGLNKWQRISLKLVMCTKVNNGWKGWDLIR